MGELAGGIGAGEEEEQGDGGVGGGKGGVVEDGKDEGYGEEDGVAGLVGGEAVVFRKGDGILGRANVSGKSFLTIGLVRGAYLVFLCRM